MTDKKKPDQAAGTELETEIVEDTTSQPNPDDPQVAEEDAPRTGDASDAAKDDASGSESGDLEHSDVDKLDPAEDVSEPEPEPEPEPAAQLPVTTPAKPRNGFAPALLGGVVAAALGFVAGKAPILDPLMPAAWRSVDHTEALVALEGRLAALDQSQTALGQRLDGIVIPDLAPLENQVAALPETVDARLKAALDGVTATAAALQAQVVGYEARLTEIEKRPLAEALPGDALDAYEREVEALRAAAQDQRKAVEDLIAEAQSMKAEAVALEAAAVAEARRAALSVAVSKLRAELDAGRGFAEQAAALTEQGLALPDVLSAVAQDGVATSGALADGFAPAARLALAAARTEKLNGGDRGVMAFVQRQLGARSVAPRDGDDPDAILSRAEAAAQSGRLDAALAEVEALPDSARAEMADWAARVRTRLDALAAADDLAASLNSN